MKRFALLITLCGLAFVGLQAANKPHMVFILADDLGYAEVGCCGH